MKRFLVKTLVAMLVLSFPGALMAASHGHGEHGKKETAEKKSDQKGHDGHGAHAGHDMKEDMIMLGEEVKEGVKGTSHLKDVGAAMAKLGKKENYHFMITFEDAKTGKPIVEGTVAVKVTNPGGKESGAPVELVGMDGHFGADLALTEKGEYRFRVGSKLPDGKKRQYQFNYTVK